MDIRTILIILHTIGAVLGAGAATISDLLFFKFAKEGTIDEKEFETLKTVSKVVMGGLALLIVTGIGFLILYALSPEMARPAYNMHKVWTKVAIVVIISVNGFVLHAKVLPLFKNSLGKPFATAEFMKNSGVILTAGAVSGVSWYTTLVLGAWRSLEASYTTIFSTYVAIVLIAVIVSNVVGRQLVKHLHRTTVQVSAK